MFRIDNASAVALLPSPPAAGTPGYFTDGDSSTGAPPTIVPADFLNRVQEELLWLLTATGVVPDKTQYDQVLRSLISGKINFANDTGTSNHIIASLPVAPLALGDGLTVNIRILNTNTGAADLNLNGLTAKNIYFNGAPLVGGEMSAGGINTFKYDATGGVWQLDSPIDTKSNIFTGSAPTTGSANSQVLATVTPGGYVRAYGNVINFTAGFTNSAAAQLNVSSTGLVTLKKNSGAGVVDVVSGDITSGNSYSVLDNGTYYVLISASFVGANYLQISLNLSDLASAAAARTNLGLGAAATHPLSDFLLPANNLSEVTTPATARVNIGADDAFIGELKYLAYLPSPVPANHMECDGSAVSRTTYAALFAKIGTAWGAGNGSTTFNIPNLSRRTLVGRGGTGTATLGNAVGNVGGEESHLLTTAEIPAHTHSIKGSPSDSGFGDNVGSDGPWTGSPNFNTESTGGGGTHNNIQPSAVAFSMIRYQ